MKRKNYLIAFIIIICVLIIGSLILYIKLTKNNVIANLSGTYQSEKFVKDGKQELLQLSFIPEERKYYKAYNNSYVEDGSYTKNRDSNNIYNLKSGGDESIIIIESDYIYYIEGTNVNKLKCILPNPVIPQNK